jgi:hypothetical protein
MKNLINLPFILTSNKMHTTLVGPGLYWLIEEKDDYIMLESDIGKKYVMINSDLTARVYPERFIIVREGNIFKVTISKHCPPYFFFYGMMVVIAIAIFIIWLMKY